MTKEAQDFEISQGEDLPIAIRVVDDTTDLPLDLTGFAIVWELTRAAESTDHVARFTEASPEVTIQNGAGTNDEVLIEIDAELTRTLAAGRYHHELRTNGGAANLAEQVAARGVVTLRLSPTRAAS